MESLVPGPFQWRSKFRAGCSRWTIPREVILDLLSRTPGHLSAKEIYSALYPQYPGIGLTTIYRTLELLRSLELVHRFRGTDGQSRYELKKREGRYLHPHLVCTRCGRIVDLPDFREETARSPFRRLPVFPNQASRHPMTRGERPRSRPSKSSISCWRKRGVSRMNSGPSSRESRTSKEKEKKKEKTNESRHCLR